VNLTPLKMSKTAKRVVDIVLSLAIATFIIYNYNPNSNLLSFGKDRQNLQALRSSKGDVYGFSLDSFHVEKNNIIKKNEFFGGILSAYGMTANLILLLEHEAKDIFNIRNIQAGKKYHIIKKNECDDKPVAIIYEPDNYKYVVYDFRDSINVKLVEKEIELCQATVHGVIEGTLWKALEKEGVHPSVIDLMEDALSSSVDFYHTQKGDEFRLIYENKYIDGDIVGVGKLIGASYSNDGGTSYSMLYNTKDGDGYFDAEGRPAKKAFLKAPVKFSRISSNYNLRRFHPIKGKTVPHLGTDYAAPYGTEIRSVADGVITNASYTGGNGNYVKVKHDGVYETQYLHMSRFAKGIKPGTRVKQGQTIGYVGSTGLSTGPHVCFRFWKKGKQVNHLKENLPAALPMNMTELPTFYKHRDQVINRLNEIEPAANSKANKKVNPA